MLSAKPFHRSAARGLLKWIAAIAPLLGVSLSARAADRVFDLHYDFMINDLPPAADVRIWIPRPVSDSAQDVTLVDKSFPSEPAETLDASGLNHLLYLDEHAPAAGTIPIALTYHVLRHEITSAPIKDHENVADALKPDLLVPVGGRIAQLISATTLPADDLAKARTFYDFVFDYLAYSKDKPGWGRGDVLWACDSHFGNCSDFHSLFLSLARTNNLPAKMEFGFIIPTDDRPPTIANYHCWAFFKPSCSPSWIPIDISKAKNRPQQKNDFFAHLDANRMGFSSGRDLVLTPPQAGPPINFLVYPYVEVNGQAWPVEKIERSFKIDRPTTQPVAAN